MSPQLQLQKYLLLRPTPLRKSAVVRVDASYLRKDLTEQAKQDTSPWVGALSGYWQAGQLHPGLGNGRDDHTPDCIHLYSQKSLNEIRRISEAKLKTNISNYRLESPRLQIQKYLLLGSAPLRESGASYRQRRPHAGVHTFTKVSLKF